MPQANTHLGFPSISCTLEKLVLILIEEPHQIQIVACGNVRCSMRKVAWREIMRDQNYKFTQTDSDAVNGRAPSMMSRSV